MCSLSSLPHILLPNPPYPQPNLWQCLYKLHVFFLSALHPASFFSPFPARSLHYYYDYYYYDYDYDYE